MGKKGMRFSQEDVDEMIKRRRVQYAATAGSGYTKAPVDNELRRLGYPIDAVLAEKNKRPKYGNEAVIVDGVRIPSKREAKRYRELGLLLKSRQIAWLARQVRWILPGGVEYVADFQYVDGGKLVVEDAKGMTTPEYIIKRKQMAECHGIDISEV